MHDGRVLTIGGGFAAVQFGKTSRSMLSPSECEILPFKSVNHMVAYHTNGVFNSQGTKEKATRIPIVGITLRMIGLLYSAN